MDDGIERHSANILLNEKFDPISLPAEDPTDRYISIPEDPTDRLLRIPDDGSDQYLGISDDGSDRYLGVASDGSDQYLGISDDGSDRYLGVASDGSDQYLGISDDGSDRYLGFGGGVIGGADPYAHYGLIDSAAAVKSTIQNIRGRRAWYKSGDGRVDPSTLPPGVEYLPSINRFQYKTWDQKGNIRVRLSKTPPTERELERMRHKSDISHSLHDLTASPTGRDISEEWWRTVTRGRPHPDGIPLPPRIDEYTSPPTIEPDDDVTARPSEPAQERFDMDEWRRQKDASIANERAASAKPSTQSPVDKPAQEVPGTDEYRWRLFQGEYRESAAPTRPKPEGVSRRTDGAPIEKPTPRPLDLDFSGDSRVEPNALTSEPRSSAEMPLPEKSTPKAPTPPPPAARPTEPEAAIGQQDMGAPAREPAAESDGAIRGAAVTAQGVTDPNDTYRFNWRIVDIDSLRPSHDYRTFALNPDYDPDLQPRDRQRAASLRQIPAIASKLHAPTLIDDSRTLETGPPIIGKDLQVESGNARVLALLRAKASHPDKYAIYKELLTDPQKLSELGFTPEDVQGIENPVLVREHDLSADPGARRRFVIEANTSKVAPMSVPEQAATYADAFRDRNLLKIQPNDEVKLDEWLESGAGNEVAMDFLKALDLNTAGAMADARGNLSKRGLESIKNSLFSNVYGQYPGGDRLQQELNETLDEDIKRVGAALMDSLPGAAKAEAFTRSVRRDDDLSLAGDLIAAVEKLRAIRRRNIQVGDYLRQSTFDQDLTPTQKQILSYIAENIQSGRKVRQLIDAYNRRVIEQAPTDQGAMLGGGSMDGSLPKAEMVERIIVELGTPQVLDHMGAIKASHREFSQPSPAAGDRQAAPPSEPIGKPIDIPPRRTLRARSRRRRAPQSPSKPMNVFHARS